ncbi:MAG: transcriptional regulator [Fusobacterium sp.]|uniref:transcriptional regulator n=1 Tax=Fusobacterium sp. TaxID=68766 RepID=UPI0039959513
MEKLLNEDKLLDKYEVMKILNIAEDTAIKKMREINDELKRKNKNIKILRGRVSSKALREKYNL